MQWTIRKAIKFDCPVLNQLAYESKAYWGYDEKFMRACGEELTYDKKVEKQKYISRVLETSEGIIGFYVLELLEDEKAEIDAMFVIPKWIGQGFGQVLIKDAIEQAKMNDSKGIFIQSDPHAESFYLAAGARRIGTRPSQSIKDRNLPLLYLDIKV